MANNKNITFDQLQSSMTKIKGEIDKKANTNHGTHVKYYDDNPKVAGTVTAGRSSRLSRGDHVHPAQTTITGNAGTATKLQTARTLTIGNTGKAFDGSGNVSWTLGEIGAAAASHNHTSLTGVTKLQFAAGLTDSAVMKVTTEEANTYLDFEMNDDVNTDMYRWRFSAYDTNGTTPYFNLMTLTAKDTSSARLTVNGDVTASSFTGNASSATTLQTARKIGKASFNGTSDIYLSDIMGRADTSSTANQYKNQYTKFARIDVSDRTYNACVGKISFINTEANAAKGILEFYIRTQDTIANSYIELCWSSLTDKKYADSVSAVKVSDGVFDLYYQPKNDWNTAKFTIIDCHKPKKITLYSDQGYVSSITPVCTSSLNAQYVDNIYTDYVSNRVLTLTTDKYQYAAITSNNTIINLPSVSSFTEIHLFFDWPSGISIIMPSNVKWQEGVMYGPGYTHEFIFTYINSAIGWLGGCVVYG